jgi:hypothetical protein
MPIASLEGDPEQCQQYEPLRCHETIGDTGTSAVLSRYESA